jgi:hypothetical protein
MSWTVYLSVWFMARGSGQAESTCFLEGLQTKVMPAGGQVCLCDQPPVKYSEQQGWDDWHPWLSALPGPCHTHQCWEKKAQSVQLHWERTLEAQAHLSWPLPHAPFAFPGVLSVPFSVMKPNHEYNSVSEFLMLLVNH